MNEVDDVDDRVLAPQPAADDMPLAYIDALRRQVARLRLQRREFGRSHKSSSERRSDVKALPSGDAPDDDNASDQEHYDGMPMVDPYNAEAEFRYQDESGGDSGTYKGEAIDNIRHGRGKHVCPNGDVYDGEWKEDKRHGEGKFQQAAGLRYEGSWVDDKAHGHGVCHYPNGDIYEGEWKADTRWGWGKHVFSSGDVYEGEWVADNPDGQGRYTFVDKSYFQGEHAQAARVKGKFASGDGSYEYDGDWRNEVHHGDGILHVSDVYKYSGKFQDGVRHGTGECIYASGQFYNGDWREDARDGTGEYKDSHETYKGGWRQNAKEGVGDCRYTDGSRYLGDWKAGEYEGNGKRLYADGSTYEGEWKSGKRHGKGKFISASTKETYQGEWVNDERHGYGVCVFADGSKFRGEWEDGCWLQSTADPTLTKVSGPGLSRGVAGEATMFRIEARDENKNKRMNGGDEFYVRFENDNTGEVSFAEVVDHDDGVYDVKFTTTTSGTYTCSILIGAEEHVADSPYPVRILPGRPHPRRCVISGDGLRCATTGVETSFSVRAFDSHGNAATGKLTAHLPLDVSITSNDGCADNPRVEDVGDGTYEVIFTAPRRGLYRVAVESHGVRVGESPYSLSVRDEDESDENTIPDVRSLTAQPDDLMAEWEDIALQEYMLDGDKGGWESDEDEDKETEEERAMRENPGVPVISNLEDLYKIPRLQKLQREERRKKKAAKLNAMRKRFQAEEEALGGEPLRIRDGDESIADLD